MCASAFSVMISTFLCNTPSWRIIDARNRSSDIRQSALLRSSVISSRRENKERRDEDRADKDEDCDCKFIELFHFLYIY